jgi:SanA protein
MRCLGCLTLLMLAVLAAGAFGICQWIVLRTGEGRIYSSVEMLPAREVGLLLGTTLKGRRGNDNPFFKYRVDAAADLYKRGRIKHLLVSGDVQRFGFNEPEDMKKALLAHGVPGHAITLDYAGLRTLDSIVRAKEIFGLKRFTVISQRDHDRRALLIADKFGVDAIAFAARDVPVRQSVLPHLREWFARVRAVLDLYLLHTQPKHLGTRTPLTL